MEFEQFVRIGFKVYNINFKNDSLLLPNQPSWEISSDKMVQSQFISTRKAKIFKISIHLTY